MNRTLLALFALAAGTLLLPDAAEAQRGGGGFVGGGSRLSGGGIGGGIGGGGRMGVGSIGGPRLWRVPQGGMSASRVGPVGDFRTGARAARPGVLPVRVGGIPPQTGAIRTGGIRQAAINNPLAAPDARVVNRFGDRGDWRYGVRPRDAWGARYPYYRGRYPYYGRYYRRYPYYGRYYPYYDYGGWGLAAGALIGAAATYPYYDYPYYDYSYPTDQTPIASAAGGYCVTPVRTCALINSAPIGTGCSCSVPGGRARGTVQ